MDDLQKKFKRIFTQTEILTILCEKVLLENNCSGKYKTSVDGTFTLGKNDGQAIVNVEILEVIESGF